MAPREDSTDCQRGYMAVESAPRWFSGPPGRQFLFGLSGSFCTCLVIYASIVPLQFTPLSWDESIQRWSTIPWFELGIWQRADWVANILIFIPSAFLLSGYFCCSNRCGALVRLLKWSAVMGMLSALVLLIELVQIWFPPRTVSWNDVAAGIVGVILGGVAWLGTGPSIECLLVRMLQSNSLSAKFSSITLLAMLSCLIYSLYPFDLVLSLSELDEKRNAGRLRWWTEVSGTGWFAAVKGWLVSALRMVPFGAWFGFKFQPRLAIPTICLTAILFELLQLPIFSKHSACDEIPAGILGGLSGWLLVGKPNLWRSVLKESRFWFLGIAVCVVLLPLLFIVRGDAFVTDPQEIADRWWGMLSPPLTRYYFTSEYNALTNLAGKVGIFSILGVLFAGYALSRHGDSHPRVAISGFFVTGVLGIAIEVLQVYRYPLIADIWDIAIYLIGFLCGRIAGFWVLADWFREFGT